MSNHIERAAEVITWADWPDTKNALQRIDASDRIARALAAAGLLVTPEQQAVLDAAEAWRTRRDGYVKSDFVHNELGGTSWGLIDAVDALRASQTTHCPTCADWLPHPADTSLSKAGCPDCERTS